MSTFALQILFSIAHLLSELTLKQLFCAVIAPDQAPSDE